MLGLPKLLFASAMAAYHTGRADVYRAKGGGFHSNASKHEAKRDHWNAVIENLKSQ